MTVFWPDFSIVAFFAVRIIWKCSQFEIVYGSLYTANGIKVEGPALQQCAKLVLLLAVSSGQLPSIDQSVYRLRPVEYSQDI